MVIKVGIIGTGFGAKVHLPAFQRHDKFQVVSIAGRNEQKVKEIADNAGVESSTDWTQFLKDDRIDLIAVTPPPYHHYKMAKKTLLADKHLLLEKPTTTTALQARKLTTIAQDRNLIGMMAHEFRWMPDNKFLERLVVEDKIVGRLREVHVNLYNGFVASPENPPFRWLWDSRYDGGALGAGGSHYVDMIRTITGLEFINLSGHIYTRTELRKRDEGGYAKVTADDGFSLTFELENKVTGVLNVSWTVSPSPPSRIILSGDKGTVYQENRKLFSGSIGGEFEERSIHSELDLDMGLAEKDERIPPFLKLLDEVAKSIEDGVSYSPNLVDGWRNQQVLDATRKSHETNSRINIVDYL
ncbi:MAG: Gfo/Idh/MocA family oxidoreductase [Candidatus Heimdallarchaeota archaeon]|nr:Gfo/Idh/MocA family oxidoreductase [Candidatus Heimdallarchaeota archaeon]